MKKRLILFKLLPPVGAFLIGLFVPIALDSQIRNLLPDGWTVLLSILVAVLVMQGISIVLLATTFSEFKQDRSVITTQLDEMGRRFGLRVEFVEEDDDTNAGKTYEATTRLIQRAKTSLLFVDFWVKTSNYHERVPSAKGKRQEYYDAIIEQIRNHKNHSGERPFHVRMIQKPQDIEADPVYSAHLKACCQIQDQYQTVSVIKIASPHIHAHFAIIDERFVVWPILTSGFKGGSLRRHGALIFDDPNKYLVNQLKAIYTMLDTVARAYPPEADTPALNNS